jgi:transcriptional regulator
MELLRGTLDLLVLKTLTIEPMHGYGIARHLRQVSEEMLHIEEGSLYPALQRMRQKGWIKAEWGQTPNNQRARYYTITAAGRKQLEAERRNLDQMFRAITLVMEFP